jgi:hypothetical protein
MNQPMDNIKAALAIANADRLQTILRHFFTVYSTHLQGSVPTSIQLNTVNAPYPTEDTLAEVQAELGPQHTVALAATLGYRAGVLGSPELACNYEALLRTLDGLHEHGLQYGVMRKSDSQDSLDVLFIVQVPADPNTYVQVWVIDTHTAASTLVATAVASTETAVVGSVVPSSVSTPAAQPEPPAVVGSIVPVTTSTPLPPVDEAITEMVQEIEKIMAQPGKRTQAEWDRIGFLKKKTGETIKAAENPAAS